MDGQVYLQLLKEIVPKIAGRGGTVIVGRGAQFILRGFPDTYHVLLVAKKPDRIRFMIDHYNLLLPQAKRIVSRQDKRRMRLMQLFSQDDFDRPWNYDLVLNMSKLTLHAAATAVCSLLGQPAEATEPTERREADAAVQTA
jgi:cytidylate kinase